MNLIYMCVFHQMSYINLLTLLITSILAKANINKETTDILIITSPSFQPLIKNKLESFNLDLCYYILDLHSLFDAGCSRLNIFKYENINKYNKILYLDTDILLNSDINVLFNLEITSDKIYALEEGNIEHEYWGGQFFDFNKFNRTESAFTSGILLFSNSDSMKLLFNTIQTHIVDYIYTKKNGIPICLDQPFIVYNAISQNKYDNQVLKSYVENNPSVVSSEKIVYHFPGTPGFYDSKFYKMSNFWAKIESFIVVDEEIICKNILDNKKYSWQNHYITFLENGLMDAFGKGNYIQTDIYTFQANFGNRKHSLTFNNDYTEFTSTRYDDNELVKGKLL